MYIERWTWYIKSDKVDEAVKHCEEGMKTVWAPSSKFYTPMFGPPYDTLVVDFEFENLAALEKFWEQAGESEAWGAWGKKWGEMQANDRRGAREVWQIGGT